MAQKSKGAKVYLYFVGFTLIFLAFTGLSIYSYKQYTQLRHDLNTSTRNNASQLRSAMAMRVAVRERAIVLWQMVLVDDLFDRDLLFQQFYQLGSKYQEGRLFLLNSTLSEDEKKLLKLLDQETQKRAPVLRQFADFLMEGKQADFKDQLNRVLSEQVIVADLLDSIIALQQNQNELAQRNSDAAATKLLSELILFMIMMICGGFMFAGYVIMSTSQQSKLLAIANRELEHLACHDSLTSLPNRMLLLRQLQTTLATMRRTQQRAAVLFIDIDNFKPVNDNYGHSIGDHYLIELTDKMNSSLRGSDILGRLGGDEFLVILNDAQTPAQAIAVAQKLLSNLNQEVSIKGISLQSSASIGIYMLTDETLTPEETIMLADKAMYQAKKAGKNQYYLL